MTLSAHPDLYLWCVAVDDPRIDAGLLSSEEQERSARFRVADARDRFVAGRWLLRSVLARITGGGPSRIVLAAGEHGKPRLTRPEVPGLGFNLSHAGRHAVVAVAAGAEVGVDLEALPPRVDVERLAARFYAATERDAVLAAGAEERDRRFLEVWTGKESWLKATGIGIAVRLAEVEVALDPPRLVSLPGRHDPADWSLLPAGVAADAVCTVAVRGSGWRIVVSPLPPS